MCIRSQKNSESRVCCAYSEMLGGVLDQGVIFRGALFCHPGTQGPSVTRKRGHVLGDDSRVYISLHI